MEYMKKENEIHSRGDSVSKIKEEKKKPFISCVEQFDTAGR